MRNGNVHHFPAQFRVTQTAPEREAAQLELFDHGYGSVRAISYLDIAVLNQDQLIRSVTKNAVRTVIDLRSVPVFPKPRFDHRYLMSYFYDRSVDYVEFALAERAPVSQACKSLNRVLNASVPLGLAACIIDEDAVRAGAVASFRNSLAQRAEAYVEIHPRAMI